MNTLALVDPGQLDHAENPSARVPVAILADVSASMAGKPLEALQRGLTLFFSGLESDPRAQLSCDPTIFAFGGAVRQVMPWESRMVGMTPTPNLSAGGDTPLGQAVTTAIEAINQRRRLYREKAIQSYRPWMVILSDGHPTDEWQAAAEALSKLVNEHRWNVICVATGPDADVECLARFTPARPPIVFRSADVSVCFRELFQWISSSIKVSSRRPGAEPQMAPLPDNIALAS